MDSADKSEFMRGWVRPLGMSLFPQYISQGPEEHAVPGQLPGPQHALPPRASDGKHILGHPLAVREPGSPWP